MSDIKSELLRSAARELCSFIDDANVVLNKGISCNSETPPDYHDHQTCCELDKAADYMDSLVEQSKALRAALNKVLEISGGSNEQNMANFDDELASQHNDDINEIYHIAKALEQAQ